MLSDVESEDDSCRIAATVMTSLSKTAPAGHAFPSVEDWAGGFQRLRRRYNGTTGPFPREITQKAERLFSQLARSSEEPVVLRGDLRHFNILYSDSGRWLAIDPKGVIGELAYEIGALLRNRLPNPLRGTAARNALARRISLMAEYVGLNSDRVRSWSLAQAVLSAWWTIEDGGEYDASCEEMIALVETLDSLTM